MKALPAIIATLSLAAIAFGAVTLFRTKDKTELERAEDAARAAGLPLLASDLQSGEELPEDQNAAVFIMRAVEKYNSIPKARELVDTAHKAALENRVEEARQALQTLQPALDDLELASKLERADFMRDPDLGSDVLYPELAHIKQLSRAMQAEAYVKLRERDIPGATDILRVQLKVAEHVAANEALIPFLASLAFLSHAGVVAEHIISKADQAELDELIRVLQARKQPDLDDAVRRDHYMTFAMLRNIDKPKREQETEEEYLARVRREGYPEEFKNQEALILHTKGFADVYIALRRGGNPSEVAQRVQQAENRYGARFGSSVAEFVKPVVSKVVHSWAESEARYRALEAIALAGKYAQQNQEFPTSVDELEAFGQVPLDPYTERPMLLNFSDRGLRIYSVGKDLTDQGGIVRREARKEAEGDEFPYDVGAGIPPIF